MKKSHRFLNQKPDLRPASWAVGFFRQLVGRIPGMWGLQHRARRLWLIVLIALLAVLGTKSHERQRRGNQSPKPPSRVQAAAARASAALAPVAVPTVRPNPPTPEFQNSEAATGNRTNHATLVAVPRLDISSQPDDPLSALIQRGEPVLNLDEPLNVKGDRRRVRILRTDFAYPLIRLEERIRPGAKEAEPRVDQRLAMVADRILVRKQPAVTWAQVAALCQTNGLSMVEQLPDGDTAVFQMAWDGQDRLPEKVKNVNRHKSVVACAEPDYLRAVSVVPSDLTDKQWALQNLGAYGLFHADIDATEAWDRRSDASTIKVAVVDTGVRYSHEDLADNIWTNRQEIPGNRLTTMAMALWTTSTGRISRLNRPEIHPKPRAIRWTPSQASK